MGWRAVRQAGREGAQGFLNHGIMWTVECLVLYQLGTGVGSVVYY
jgi:hypothetical protein